MKKAQLALLTLTGCLILSAPSAALATTGWMIVWLNEYPEACQDLVDAAESCTLCHGVRSTLNAYSGEMINLDFAATEELDSDGDGRTNGQEILEDCTLPGDAGSVSVELDTWGAIKVLYR